MISGGVITGMEGCEVQTVRRQLNNCVWPVSALGEPYRNILGEFYSRGVDTFILVSLTLKELFGVYALMPCPVSNV